MSTFGGLMREYRQFSIDRFDGHNLRSQQFFLSHCHQDHMVGLDLPAFARVLQDKSSAKLYVHEITVTLLLADDRYLYLEPHIVALPVNDPTTVSYLSNNGEEKTVTVTLLPAGHCIGSVMFLFDGDEGKVLYTGDIRLSVNDVKKMRDSLDRSQLRSLYMDTTFFTPKTYWFPARDVVAPVVQQESQRWLSKSPNHRVLLYLCSKYGHEFLLQRLAASLRSKVS
jgi:DNA cross-link repair 1C protein